MADNKKALTAEDAENTEGEPFLSPGWLDLVDLGLTPQVNEIQPPGSA